MDQSDKPTSGAELRAALDSELTRAIVITSEQRLKDKIDGWNECYSTIYNWVNKRYGPRAAGIFKQFEYRGTAE